MLVALAMLSAAIAAVITVVTTPTVIAIAIMVPIAITVRITVAVVSVLACVAPAVPAVGIVPIAIAISKGDIAESDGNRTSSAVIGVHPNGEVVGTCGNAERKGTPDKTEYNRCLF